MSVLSKSEIIKHVSVGNIIIDPFIQEHLGNCSYDVMLGNWFFKQNDRNPGEFFNPVDENDVKALWGEPLEAYPAAQFRSPQNPLNSIHDEELIIPVYPNETILAHTIEYIGGRNGKLGGVYGKLSAVTTSMRARSSLGRAGITCCKDAGWGDIGYVNRWTMEITNVGNYPVPIPVGLRIAQIVFYETQAVDEADIYKGKYQSPKTLEELKRNWKPQDMLPRLHKDPELGQFQKYYQYL